MKNTIIGLTVLCAAIALAKNARGDSIAFGQYSYEGAVYDRNDAALAKGASINIVSVDSTITTELAKFEGTWALISSERNGQSTSEEKNPYTLTFTGDKWKVHRGAEV